MATKSAEGRMLHERVFCLGVQLSKGKDSYSAVTNAGGISRHLVSFMLRAEISIAALLSFFLNQLQVAKRIYIYIYIYIYGEYKENGLQGGYWWYSVENHHLHSGV
jgi:hypothetical protein